MRKLDAQERKIIRELIKNPRNSDNKIAKKTGIPVMTVNRKRKRLEEQRIVNYYTSVQKHEDGIGIFGARQLYIIKLRAGITRSEYIQKIELDYATKIFNSTFISTTYIGEKDGHLAIIVVVDAENNERLVEEFNGKIITILRKKFGEDVIKEIITARINDTVRVHHNYMPKINMEQGIIQDDWQNELIFVDDEMEKNNTKKN